MDYIYGYKENLNKFSLREIYKLSLFVYVPLCFVYVPFLFWSLYAFYHNERKEQQLKIVPQN